MNLADANNVSPLLDEFSLGSPYSSHNGIICCPAIHAVTKEKFILKQISIPESQTQVNAMLLTGACADKAAAQRYYADITQGLVEEIHLLERLAPQGCLSLHCYTGHEGGAAEEAALAQRLARLEPRRWRVLHCRDANRETHSESILLAERLPVRQR